MASDLIKKLCITSVLQNCLNKKKQNSGLKNIQNLQNSLAATKKTW